MCIRDSYESPLGRILLAADEDGLTGLWFEGQKYFARGLAPESREMPLPVFDQAKNWLDLYFSGKDHGFTTSLCMETTPFRKAVWEILLTIPYGQVMT